MILDKKLPKNIYVNSTNHNSSFMNCLQECKNKKCHSLSYDKQMKVCYQENIPMYTATSSSYMDNTNNEIIRIIHILNFHSITKC